MLFKVPYLKKNMRYLYDREAEQAQDFLNIAVNYALESKCLRSKCASIISNRGEIIGKGFNSPPQNICLENCVKDNLPVDFPSDRTCCIHAEQRAINDALRRNAGKISGSRLYFIRLDETGKIKKAGKPYCTICSKSILDVNIAEVVLWYNEGITVYNANEYNELSFQFKGENLL